MAELEVDQLSLLEVDHKGGQTGGGSLRWHTWRWTSVICGPTGGGLVQWRYSSLVD